MTSRRSFLIGGGVAIAAVAVPRLVPAAEPADIRMLSTPRGEEAWFDPIGLHVPPGQTVRWIMA
jgi:hypothetical protein